MFILADNVLAPLDFGQVARLSRANRKLISELILAVPDADGDRTVRAFNRAGLLDERTDVEALKGDLEAMLDNYSHLPLKDIPMGQMIAKSFAIIRNHRIHPPAEFTLMLKSLMTIESLAGKLDGDFQLLDHIRPYARRMAMQRLDPRRVWPAIEGALRDAEDLAAAIPRQVDAVLASLRTGRLQIHVQHEHLEALTHTLDRASNRVAFSLIIAGTVVASSLLVTQEKGMLFGLVGFQTLGSLGYLTAAILGMWLVISIVRSRKV